MNLREQDILQVPEPFTIMLTVLQQMETMAQLLVIENIITLVPIMILFSMHVMAINTGYTIY